MRRKSPQQKKAESYAKDHRNTYGENAKSSRKSIAQNQRLRNRAERRVAREMFTGGTVDEERVDAVEARLKLKRRKAWTKWPDEPLGVVVAAKLARRRRIALASRKLRQLLADVRAG
jgi:hypothetical protein